MQESNKLTKSDVIRYRELKIKYLDTRAPKEAYAIHLSGMTTNQKIKLYSYWTRYMNMVNTVSDKPTFLEREQDMKTCGIQELTTMLFTRKSISLRRSSGNPFLLLLRPNIKKEYADWLTNIREEYGVPKSLLRPVRGRRKSPYRLYIYPDYSKYSNIFDVAKSIKILYELAKAYKNGEIASGQDLRHKLCELCKDMGHVPSFQTGTIVKLYDSIKDYYNLYLVYDQLGDDLLLGESFAYLNKRYKLTKMGIYNIKSLYAAITIHASIVALYLRTKGHLISRVFNTYYTPF